MSETLLSVGIDTGTSCPPTGQPVWGPRYYVDTPAGSGDYRPAENLRVAVDFTGIRPPRGAGPRWWRCRNE